ncbi:MAG: sec-independent protein translocase protein TatB [Ilumatobacteraceae bacterium]|jgi:sec-independent protein translocase protein TatB
MFNLSSSELVFLLLIALIVLGPEKLPEAVRKFGKVYAEAKKMSTGFQSELKSALDEPMREMRETAEAFKSAANLNFDLEPDEAPAEPVKPAEPLTPVTTQDPIAPENPVTAIEADDPADAADGADQPGAPRAANQPPSSSGEAQHVADQLEAIEATLEAQRGVVEPVEETATE